MKEITFDDNPYCPSKLICVGRNYIAHAQELGNPIPEEMVVFLKPNSAISDSLLSYQDESLHYELELCFIVRDQHLAGLGLGIDLTKRGLQSRLKAKGLPWERAKAFDGAATFSKFIPLPQDISDLHFDLHIDGTPRQHGRLRDMMFSPQQIIEQVSAWMTLEDGDILMTGTPEGVGEIEKGANFSARIFSGGACLLEHSWVSS